MSLRTIRAELAADPQLGTGNVLTTLVARGEGLDEPSLTFDTDVDGHPALRALTLRELDERVAARAAALHALGVKPRDPVAVQVTAGADQVLSFLALARLGAIPALVNGRLPAEPAAEFIRRLRAAALLTDAAHRTAFGDRDLGVPQVIDVAGLGAGDPAAAPAPFRHRPGDPAVITHSSGTTGLPKAVAHSHAGLFASVRHRLALPRAQGVERLLGALPPAHAATVIAVNLALANRSELLVLSEPSGTTVLAAIEGWRPTGVLGFAAIWSELAAVDLTTRDVDSVQLWWNTGDCAHEAHIRRLVAVGSRRVAARGGGRVQPGSVFIDGLGSTEMGHSQFFITHTPETERYGRCIGKPHTFSDVAVLDEAGEPLGVGEVGQLGINAPTLALGYWNDSVTTWRTRLNDYFLTGDLVYRDEAGYYYHVDRMVDSVDLGGGRRLFTAACEERVLAALPDVLECTVVAVAGPAGADSHVLLVLTADADPAVDRTAAVLAALEEHVAATVRGVVVVDPDRLPLGPTGKVRKLLLRERYLAGQLLAPTGGAA
ncbi:class I adenylate-forming enzyme family protein [Kitasatospora cineracea]|uniref:class I adenylate-forming enzyme family protein n=1 Tax=Kitasatospora cineracea TaxID=88074 RepID=UPI0033C01C78